MSGSQYSSIHNAYIADPTTSASETTKDRTVTPGRMNLLPHFI
jgi:hypothetical protein